MMRLKWNYQNSMFKRRTTKTRGMEMIHLMANKIKHINLNMKKSENNSLVTIISRIISGETTKEIIEIDKIKSTHKNSKMISSFNSLIRKSQRNLEMKCWVALLKLFKRRQKILLMKTLQRSLMGFITLLMPQRDCLKSREYLMSMFHKNPRIIKRLDIHHSIIS